MSTEDEGSLRISRLQWRK